MLQMHESVIISNSGVINIKYGLSIQWKNHIYMWFIQCSHKDYQGAMHRSGLYTEGHYLIILYNWANLVFATSLS